MSWQKRCIDSTRWQAMSKGKVQTVFMRPHGAHAGVPPPGTRPMGPNGGHPPATVGRALGEGPQPLLRVDVAPSLCASIPWTSAHRGSPHTWRKLGGGVACQPRPSKGRMGTPALGRGIDWRGTTPPLPI